MAKYKRSFAASANLYFLIFNAIYCLHLWHELMQSYKSHSHLCLQSKEPLF